LKYASQYNWGEKREYFKSHYTMYSPRPRGNPLSAISPPDTSQKVREITKDM
jgi:hypothetical protein